MKGRQSMARYCSTAECAAGLLPAMNAAQARNQRIQAADAAAAISAWPVELPQQLLPLGVPMLHSYLH